jgi:thiol-disulfide isomerase/thioredoxin
VVSSLNSDFLQDIPMNRKELLSTQNFSTFINRLEYLQPFRDARSQIYAAMRPEKTFTQYLFEELNIPKSPEDETYLLMSDSVNIKLRAPNLTRDAIEKIMEDTNIASEKFNERHKEHYENYQNKYISGIKRLTQTEIEFEQWRIKDSIYTHILKLKPGIVYDVTKIRSLDFTFQQPFKNDKEEAWNFLTFLTSDIPEQFLQKEADRLFQKNFPAESLAAYELPDTYEAKIFKELIAPFSGKILFVDFWATTCGPCVSGIRQQKPLREKYKDSPDVDFVFITAENQSPLNAYNMFVNEQELTNTFRLTADQFMYMRQLFRFNGIPRYVLVDRDGKIIDDNFNAYNFEMRLNEMLLD